MFFFSTQGKQEYLYSLLLQAMASNVSWLFITEQKQVKFIAVPRTGDKQVIKTFSGGNQLQGTWELFCFLSRLVAEVDFSAPSCFQTKHEIFLQKKKKKEKKSGISNRFVECYPSTSEGRMWPPQTPRDLAKLPRSTGCRLQITRSDLEVPTHSGWNYITVNPHQVVAAPGIRSLCSSYCSAGAQFVLKVIPEAQKYSHELTE